MGFDLKFIITSFVVPDVKQAVLEEAAALWPDMKVPATGFLSRKEAEYPNLPRQDFLANHAHFAADKRRTDERREFDESLLTALSRKFPSLTFAFVEVECFGGHCEHQGSVWRAGEVLHREVFNDDPTSHLRLLAHVGITLPDEYFAPFTRGYFEGH